MTRLALFPHRLWFKATILSLILPCLSAIAGCDADKPGGTSREPKKVNVAITAGPLSASFYVAHAKGFFREEGLDAALQTFGSGQLAFAAMLAGKADFSTVAMPPIARAALDGKPVLIVATVCTADRTNLIIARKDKGIETIADLKGKRVGLSLGTIAEFMLHIYLTTAYVRPDEVQMVDFPPDALVAPLVNGEVDAISSWEPHTTPAKDRLGSNAVVLHMPGLYTFFLNLAATRDLADRDPEVVVQLLRGIVKANRFIREHPAEAKSIIGKNSGMDMVEIERNWEDYNFRAELNQALILSLEDHARWMLAREGRTDKIPDFLDFLYINGLKSVRPAAIRIAGMQE
jgi:NitT/TauT family transport system substrate-binding protein